MKNKEQQFILKYPWRLATILSILFVTILFLGFAFFVDDSVVTKMLFLVLGLLLLLLLIYQFVLVKKPYQFLVDLKEDVLVIDSGLRKEKKIPLKEIRGVALGTQTAKNSTTYLLQLATSPEFWCKYYHKNEEKTAKYVAEYEEMYLVIGGGLQKQEPMEQLVECLEGTGIASIDFVEPILGKYPGKIRANQKAVFSEESSPALKRHKRLQMLSYFLITFFICMTALFMLVSLVGRFNGIYW